jgi:hypothetical protein
MIKYKDERDLMDWDIYYRKRVIKSSIIKRLKILTKRAR